MFAGLAEIAHLPFHIFDIGDLIIAVLGQLVFLFLAQGRGLQLLAHVVYFVQGLFIYFLPVVEFFLGGIPGVVDFCLGFLGLVIFLKRALHIERTDFQRALCKSRNRKGNRQRKEYGQRLFHKTADTVVGIALDCKWIYSFKIDNQH